MNVDKDKIKRRLLIKYPFFGSIVANTDFVEDKNCYSNGKPTAATDGEKVYYHPDAVIYISEDEQVSLFAHEICHIAFDHILRSEGKIPELWNIATDAVINALLKQDGLPLIDGSIDIAEAINYDAEQFYEKLLKDKNNSQTENGNSQNKQSSKTQDEEQKNNSKQPSGKNTGHDSHSMWQKAVDKKNQHDKQNENSHELLQSSSDSKVSEKSDEEYDKKSKQNNNNEETIKNNPQLKKQKRQKEEQVKKLTELGETKAFKQNKIERKKQLEELRQALANQSYGAGNGSNGDERKITDIGISSQLIDWRRILKEAVKYDIDWSYKNAQIEDGVVTPYLEEILQPETEILLDTSGSISEVLLKNFLRECKNILQMSKVKVGCFDDAFYGFTEIRTENDIDNMHFIGGGGTDFNVAVNAFTRRVENKVIFTDGEAPMPNKSIDAIWIIFGNKKINPPGGRVIYIDEQQLMKLKCSLEVEITNKVR